MYSDFEPLRAAQGLPPSPDRLGQWLDRVTARGLHLVAVAPAGRIFGHVMLVPLDTRTAELASFVHQSARSRGIGSALATAAVRLARDHGYRRVWLSVEPSNRAAVRSYTRAGFTRVPGSAWAPELEMAIDFPTDPVTRMRYAATAIPQTA
jgi:ribosomal protein S18 acetylase RimI-like enzyme